MKGMYAGPNSLNGPSDYWEKIQELRYCEHPLKIYKSLFEEFIHYCHIGYFTMIKTFIHCGIVLQRTYSKTGLIFAISSFPGQESSKINKIGTHLSEQSLQKVISPFDEL